MKLEVERLKNAMNTAKVLHLDIHRKNLMKATHHFELTGGGQNQSQHNITLAPASNGSWCIIDFENILRGSNIRFDHSLFENKAGTDESQVYR